MLRKSQSSKLKKNEIKIGKMIKIIVPISAGAKNKQAANFSLYKSFFNCYLSFTKIFKYYNILIMKRTLILEIILFIFLIILLLFLGAKIFKRTFDIGTTYHVSFSDIDGMLEF